MEGLGNDYVYVDLRHETVADPASVARAVSDRRFGIGSDGLILIGPSDRAAVRMQMWNADGSRGEMCGNGLRCVARYAVEHGITDLSEFVAETDAGLKTVEVHRANGTVSAVTVDMGAPILERVAIPMLGAPGRVVRDTLNVGARELEVTCLSMGNPHCVTVVDDVDAYPVTEIGPLLESHEAFPNRVNAEFIRVVSRTEIQQRTWERGSGETHACGTGACAVAVAAQLLGLVDTDVTIHLRGGDLRVRWSGDENAPVLMTGPAVEVFQGEFDL